MAAVQLQCSSGRDQGEETQLQSRSQGKEGQPWPKPPCIAFGKSCPQGHQLHYLWVGLEPRQPNPLGGWEWAEGLGTPFCPYWSPLPTSPVIPWPNARFFLFRKQASASKRRHPQQCWLPLHCPRAIPLPNAHFPKPSKPSAVPTCSSSTQSAAWIPTSSFNDLMPIAFPCPNYYNSSNTHGHLGYPV